MMSVLRRTALSALRNFRPRADAPQGSSFFGPGTRSDANGILFSETPPPPGQSRKMESWEPGWYFMIFGGGALLFFGLPARPETSYVGAAREEAAKRLKEEGVI